MILSYGECEVCGDEHHHSLHGEGVMTVDHGRDTLIGGTHTLIQRVCAFLTDQPQQQREALSALLDEATKLYVADKQDVVSEDLDERISDFCADTDDKLEAILVEAGFVLVNNADAGCWNVFHAVTEAQQQESINQRDIFIECFTRAAHDEPDMTSEEMADKLLLTLDAYNFVLDMQRSR